LIQKPMLAEKITDEQIEELSYPLLVTPKIDGIRCIVVNGKALTRSLKPIPNHFVRTMIEASCPDGFDGEIVVEGGFNATQSAVMSAEGTPDFRYLVFDFLRQPEPYSARMQRAEVIAFNPLVREDGTVEALLGALVVRQADGTVFQIGTGFSHEQRQEIWGNQAEYLGRMAHFRYQAHGTLNKPRHPVFFGFRSPLDLSEAS
jgi:ATP-dependent DNA ligase